MKNSQGILNVAYDNLRPNIKKGNRGARKTKDIFALILIWLSAFFTATVLLIILSYVIIKGIGNINFNFLFTVPHGDEGGILPMIISTFYIIIISVLISTPIGVCGAIYLVEYAKKGKILKIIRFSLDSLAGIPSIIYGIFGMIFFVITFKMGWSIISGSLTLSIMVLPTIIRTTEETLKSVPDAFREASFGLGASKLGTIFRIILPSSWSGILTAIILSIGRIVGESAAVYLTAGTVPRIPSSLLDGGQTLSVHMYILAKEGISFEKAYATATVLIIIVAIMNFLANMLGRKLKKI